MRSCADGSAFVVGLSADAAVDGLGTVELHVECALDDVLRRVAKATMGSRESSCSRSTVGLSSCQGEMVGVTRFVQWDLEGARGKWKAPGGYLDVRLGTEDDDC